MANPFQTIKTKAGDQDRSFAWYQQAVREVGNNIKSFGAASRTDLGEITSQLEPGNMYMFVYDAKYKDTLPYYDRFPLCLPFDDTSGGFAGINFHYLPFLMRAGLLGELLNLSDRELTETSKIDLSWRMLKGFSKYPEAKPAVKKYLYSQVNSRFLKIKPEHWKASIFLPTADFANGSLQKVHRDSRDKING